MTRGLNLTAGLYFLFWINAWYGLYHRRKELQHQRSLFATGLVVGKSAPLHCGHEKVDQ
ncbi:hypothetical protein [Klebsiella pneumoniae]|uniref:hypothetical protein n=1 Tax=Klebsiella pneumoniae TaxID=573 RepID=UPI00388DF3AB